MGFPPHTNLCRLFDSGVSCVDFPQYRCFPTKSHAQAMYGLFCLFYSRMLFSLVLLEDTV